MDSKHVLIAGGIGAAAVCILGAALRGSPTKQQDQENTELCSQSERCAVSFDHIPDSVDEIDALVDETLPSLDMLLRKGNAISSDIDVRSSPDLRKALVDSRNLLLSFKNKISSLSTQKEYNSDQVCTEKMQSLESELRLLRSSNSTLTSLLQRNKVEMELLKQSCSSLNPNEKSNDDESITSLDSKQFIRAEHSRNDRLTADNRSLKAKVNELQAALHDRNIELNKVKEELKMVSKDFEMLKDSNGQNVHIIETLCTELNCDELAVLSSVKGIISYSPETKEITKSREFFTEPITSRNSLLPQELLLQHDAVNNHPDERHESTNSEQDTAKSTWEFLTNLLQIFQSRQTEHLITPPAESLAELFAQVTMQTDKILHTVDESNQLRGKLVSIEDELLAMKQEMVDVQRRTVDLIHEEFSKSSKLIEELSALQKLHDEIQDKVVVALKDLSVSQGELFEANDKCDRLSNALTMIESKLSIKEEEAINLLSDNQYKAKLIEIDSNTIAQLNAELERFKYSAESAARVPSTVELSEALCANIDIKDRREIQIENSNLKEALAAREYDLQKAKDILEIGGTSIAKLREELLKLKKLYKTLKTEKSIAMNRVAELESILLIGNKASTDSIDIVATDLTGQLQCKLDSSYLQHIDAGEDENKDPTTSDPSSGTIFSSWW